MHEPGLFFSMYSPPRTEASFRPARQRLEDDLHFASKMVRHCATLRGMLAKTCEDSECVRDAERVPFCAVLLAVDTPAFGSFETNRVKSAPSTA